MLLQALGGCTSLHPWHAVLRPGRSSSSHRNWCCDPGAITCSGSCQRISGPGCKHSVCAMQHSWATVSLLSVLSLAAVWIPVVLAAGWLIPALVRLFAQGSSAHTDPEEQICVMSSWSGTEKPTALLLPGSHNSQQMRNKYSLGLPSHRQDRFLLVLGYRNLVKSRKASTRAQPVTAFAHLSCGAP